MEGLRQLQVEQAKKAGVSEFDIWERLLKMPDIKAAFRGGVPEEDIKSHVGLALSDREKATVERKAKLEKLKPFLDELKKVPGKVLQPFKRTAEIWGQEAKAGYQTMAEELQNLSWKSAYRLPMGAAQYAFSPLTGFAKGAVGEPIEEALNAARVPPGVSKFAGQMGQAGVEMASPAGIAKSVGWLKKLPKSPVKYMPKSEWEKLALKTPTEKPIVTSKISETLNVNRGDVFLEGKQGIILKKGVSEKLVSDVAEAATDAIAGDYDKSRRIFHQITDKLAFNEVQIEDLPGILKKYNLSPKQFAMEYRNTVSSAGRVLSYQSKVVKRLRAAFKDEGEALKLLEDAVKAEIKEQPFSDKLFRAWAVIDQPRRAILVSQLATAMRNAWSQAGRVSLGTLDNAMQEVMQGGSTRDAIKSGLTTLSALRSRMSPKGWKRLNNILESDGAAIAKARLISQPVHEVGMGSKFAHTVNIVNRGQEYFFRKLAFEAKLKSLMGKKGLDFSTIDPKKIPDGMVEESVEYALEMTFAASAKGKHMKEFIRMWSRSPLTTINPFPRFAFANALPFVLEHSPLGYLKAFSPKVLEALASGHPERFAKAASRATIGTLMFESAWHVRQSKYAGEKWYEIKVGKPDPKTGKQKMIDMRAYAPLSTPFFLAELFIDLTRPEEERRMDAKDLAEAAIGLNRIAGSGLVFVDLLKTKKIESAKDLLSRFLGAYIGSYSVTAKTAKDIIAGTIDPEEAIYRDTKQNPVIAPFLQNIPFVSKLLPEAVSPITADRVRAISPAQRQLTGLTVKYKLPIHQEIDKLNISWSMIYPTTGIKEADREIAKKMGPMTDAYAPSVILTNPAYTEGSPTKKRILLKTFFKAIRQEAKEKMKITHPRLMGKIAIGGIGYDEKKYFKEQTGIDLNKLFE